ncbi:MAG: helix-turn-helix domain-containing protein [Dialister invisus]
MNHSRRGSATIVEVASVLGVDKSTVSRLMATLMHYDMVSIDPVSKKYRLGFRNLYLAKELKKIQCGYCSAALPIQNL